MSGEIGGNWQRQVREGWIKGKEWREGGPGVAWHSGLV